MARFDPERHHRGSHRLKGFDYSQPGAYFITICAQNRVCIFGDALYGKMLRNQAGDLVESMWFDLTNRFPSVTLDAYVVMPNHLHAIVIIQESDTGVSLSGIVQAFKSLTTNEYSRRVKENDWPAFEGRLWQRDYYDCIIKNDSEMQRIREYITHNPLHWHEDIENPMNSTATV
jgi:putative transposase